MSNAFRKFMIIGLSLLIALIITGCNSQQLKIPATATNNTNKQIPVNCAALKRQQLYNQTNMNIETNDTSATQRAALNALIAENCH